MVLVQLFAIVVTIVSSKNISLKYFSYFGINKMKCHFCIRFSKTETSNEFPILKCTKNFDHCTAKQFTLLNLIANVRRYTFFSVAISPSKIRLLTIRTFTKNMATNALTILQDITLIYLQKKKQENIYSLPNKESMTLVFSCVINHYYVN